MPGHESAVRRLLADAHGRPYRPLRWLGEAQSYPDGVAIFEGDWGGQIYATCPAALVRCSEETLERLLRDFDALGWCQLDGARIYYERLPAGAGVAGGMGGGRVEHGLWVHERIARLGLTPAIREVLAGARAPGTSIYYDLPAWEDVAAAGFTFGRIDDFVVAAAAYGNAFVVAPDGSRAGLRWHTVRRAEDLAPYERSARAIRFYTQPDYFEERRPPEPQLWGIWDVAFPHPMRLHDPAGVREDARRNLAAVAPRLAERWGAWRRQFPAPAPGAAPR